MTVPHQLCCWCQVLSLFVSLFLSFLYWCVSLGLGLTGDSSAGYVRRVAQELIRRHSSPLRVACYNPRGRGGNPIRTPFLYSAGYTEDLRAIVKHIRTQYPDNELFAAGFSLGGNYLAKYVGEEGANCHFTAAACLASPIDCLGISSMLQNSFVGKYIMDPALTKSVQKLRIQFEQLLRQDPRFDIDLIKNAKTMEEFDGAVIAPMFEYSSASAYYRWSSSGLVLDQIRRPTLFIHASNDPVVSVGNMRFEDFRKSPYLLSVLTREGGHSMDWFQASGKPWIAGVVSEFFKEASVQKKCKKKV